MAKIKEWTPMEIMVLQRDFPTTSVKVLSKRLGRTVGAINTKASLLGLKKVRYGLEWTPQMLSLLTKYFPTMFNKQLATLIGVSTRSVIRKARELGIDKIPDFHERKKKEIALLLSAKQKKGDAPTRFKKGGDTAARSMSSRQDIRSQKSRKQNA